MSISDKSPHPYTQLLLLISSPDFAMLQLSLQPLFLLSLLLLLQSLLNAPTNRLLIFYLPNYSRSAYF